MLLADLRPNEFYWARRFGHHTTEVVQISTVFGSAPEFLTMATVGSEQHYTLEEFDFISEVTRPPERGCSPVPEASA